MSKISRFARGVINNPVEAVLSIPEHFSVRHEYQPDYKPDPDWQARLHGWFDAAWPCPECAALDGLWHKIAEELEAKQLRVGRETYGEYSDAETGLACAVWCTVLHQRPTVVLETGVARGVTSRIVLEAFMRNGQGHLWSIDLLHPFDKTLHSQIGVAVHASHRALWTYIEGSSRRRLPPLLRSLPRVDLFIHDSLHTARNMRFEMERTLRTMRSGGVMVIDDIGTHQAFAEFAHDFPALETMVCPHSDRPGSFFGIVRV